MAEYAVQISDFEQGGFYASNGQNYNSTTEIRSGQRDLAMPQSIRVDCPGYQWSFICLNSTGAFTRISVSSGYKDSGTVIDLSSFTWIRYIRVELHSSDGITPPAVCTLTYTYAWHIDSDGYPTNENFIDMPEKSMSRPYPDALWRIDTTVNDGLPYNKLMPYTQGIDLWALERENVIRVYDMSEPQDGFTGNGLAVLHPISCVSIHNDDRWDIDLTHPLDDWGKWKTLLVENVLKIDGQLFRIDKQNPHIDSSGQFMTVHASHITSDLADELIIDSTFPGGNGAAFVDWAFSSKVPNVGGAYFAPYEFTGSSDIDTVLPEEQYSNVSLLGVFIGVDNSLINRTGGELYRDNFYFSINKRMQYARDNAFYLRYSLDMTEISQEIDYSEFCTDLWCYDNWGNMWAVSYTGDIKWAVHHPVRRMVKFNYPEFEGSMERLSADGAAYFGRICTPKVTYKIRIAALKNDPKYADFVDLQNYNYGDSGTIYCPELDISTTQKIVEIEKNELTGEIISMTLGNLKNSVTRPVYMGSTITSGNSSADKINQAMQQELVNSRLKLLRSWSGASTFTWNEISAHTWKEVEDIGS